MNTPHDIGLRLDMWTTGSATACNAFGNGHDWKFSHFRTTQGYASVPLDGCFARVHEDAVTKAAIAALGKES